MLVEKGKNVLYYYLTMLKDIHLRIYVCSIAKLTNKRKRENDMDRTTNPEKAFKKVKGQDAEQF